MPHRLRDSRPSYGESIAALFLPSWQLYAVLGAGGILGALLLGFFSPQSAADLIRETVPIQVGTAVLAIGVPLISTYAGYRRIGEWAHEYLWKVTRFKGFACAAAGTLLVSLIAWILHERLEGPSPSAAKIVTALYLSGLGWGLTIATVVGLTAILLEIIRFASSEALAKAASTNLAIEELLCALLRSTYIGIFLRAHREQLDKELAGYGRIRGPGREWECYLSEGSPEPSEKWVVNRGIKLEWQFLDYSIPEFRALERRLDTGTTVWLHRHDSSLLADDARSIALGTASPAVSDEMRGLGRHCVRARPDQVLSCPQEEQQRYLDRLRGHLRDSVAQGDRYAFRNTIEAVSAALVRFAAACDEPAIRGAFRIELGAGADASKQLWDLALLYDRALIEVLDCLPKEGESAGIRCREFIQVLQGVYRTELSECIRKGLPELLDILLARLPFLYGRLNTYCKESKAIAEQVGLDESRGFWGTLYAWVHSALDGLPDSTTAQKRRRFLLSLHQRGTQWLWIAVQHADQELVEELGQALNSLVSVAQEWKEAGLL